LPLKASRFRNRLAASWANASSTETLRLALEELAEALQDKFRQAGAGALGLLQWLKCLRSDLRYGTQVELLAEVLGQRFALKDNRPEPLEQSEGSAVQSPHDPDAQYAAKGRGKQHKAWLGYKAQVAETLPEEGQPPFLVSVVTQKATQGDEPGLDQTLAAQAQSGLGRPTELYADGGYISGPRLQRAAQEGWALMGPAKASPRRPGVDRLLSRRLQREYRSSTGLLPGRSPQRPLQPIASAPKGGRH
jgi:hypothetical protein